MEKVSFEYPGGHHGIHEISLTIRDGERVGLIGANGAGKSTLMKSLVGLIPVQGDILVDDLKLTKANLPIIRKKIGYVLQDSDHQMFMPTVLEDMIFGPVNYGLNREEAVRKAEAVLRSLHLEELKERQNHRISGGEKRMGAIAVILAMEPDLLIMDEPSASLDPRNRRKLIHTLNQLPVTKLIATHDLDLVLETCDRVILMNQGKIVADGPVENILTNRLLLEENNLELPFCLAPIPERIRDYRKA